MKFKKNILLLLSIIAISITTIASVFAWYVSSVGIIQDLSDKKLAANASYYESGTGTESDPYIISNARHLYNLAWLQDLGYYDDKIYYFKLKNDIDMSNLKLGTASSASPIPAIGIDKHPFVGVFDGNGKTISNLYVASNFASSNCITPSRIILQEHNDDTFNTTTNNIVSNYNGLFGVIKKFSDSSTSESTSESKVTNFTIAKAKIESSQNTLVGYICGYVNSNLSKVGVANSNLTLASSVTHYNSYPISKYGLVGDYNDASSGGIEWSNKPGQNNDFGGSIDMLTFARRISYIKNSAPSTNNYHAKFGTTTSGGYSWLSTSTYTDLSEKSYLPVNIDMDTTEMLNVEGTSDTTNSYYSQHTEEPILKTNSGYITGGLARTRVQLCNKDSQGIKNVVKRVSGTSTGTANMDLFSDSEGKVIDKDKLKTNIGFLTYYNGNVCAIYDDDDKDFVQSNNFVYKVKATDVSSKNYVDASTFEKYSSVKSNFLSMIYDSTNAYYTNDGSKAYGVYLAGLRFQQWSTDSTFTATTKWLGEDKEVKFHNNGVQFELKKDGYLTAIVSKYDTSGNLSFYNLYLVDNLKDANLTKINTIHKDSSGNITYNDSNDSTKIFDFAPITTTDTGLYSGQLYYFEIPIKKGIYFLSSYGSTYTSSYYPYFLYLDIGANAGDSGESSDTIGTIKDIDFTYISGDGYALVDVDNGFTLSNVTFNIDGTTTKEVSLYVMRSIKEGNLVYYYFIADGGLVITVTGSATGESTLEEFNTLS